AISHCEFAPFVRTDTWVHPGASVSPYYDSLLAKVTAHADNRADAIRRLGHALQQTWIDGVADNVDLLLATLDEPAFRSGDLHTGFLDEHHLVESTAEVPPQVLAAVSLVNAQPADDPWR